MSENRFQFGMTYVFFKVIGNQPQLLYEIYLFGICCRCLQYMSQNLVWKCNCSICNICDYEHLFIKHEDLSITNGEDQISSYSFGTGNADHTFCKICGIKSFYQPRSHPDMYSVNLRCVKNPPKVKKVIHFDGINFEDSIQKI